MQRKTLYVDAIIAGPLHIGQMSWLTLSVFMGVITVLSIAVIATITLVCYYRRRMRAMAGQNQT